MYLFFQISINVRGGQPLLKINSIFLFGYRKSSNGGIILEILDLQKFIVKFFEWILQLVMWHNAT